MDVLAALAGRHSTRAFDLEQAVGPEVLATLLWAGIGVNRPDGKKTVPEAWGVKALTIYLLREDGAFCFEPKDGSLEQVVGKDLRSVSSSQNFIRTAPVVLVLVGESAPLRKRSNGRISQEVSLRYACTTAGASAQSIYLACEALGLGTVIAASVDKDAMRAGLDLADDQTPLFVMPIGVPAEAAKEK